MSSTHKTTNIDLSQYVGTDKPTYLNDYNGDMLKIDTAIGADRADIVTAQNRADAAYYGMETNAGNITTLNGQMSAANTAIADTAGDVTTIQSLIGNGTPTTTDQTIIGAINEINSNLTELSDTDIFTLSKVSDGQSDFKGYGIYHRATKTVTVYLMSNSSSSISSRSVATGIPSAYRPSVSTTIGGIVNGNITTSISVQSDGTIVQDASGAFTSVLAIGEYVIS